MSEDYEVGITLALTDDASVGIAAVQRDLLRLDQAMAHSAVGLAELRAIASIVLKDADAGVRRAAGLAAAPAPRTTARATKAEVQSDGTPAAPEVVRMAPMASVAAVTMPMEPVAAPVSVPPIASKGIEAASKTPVAPGALPPAAAPAAPMTQPATREDVALPPRPSTPPVVVEADQARPISVAAAGAPITTALPGAPLALPPMPVTAPTVPDAGFAAKPSAPIAPAPTSPSIAQPAAPIVLQIPVSVDASRSQAPSQPHFAAPVSTVERVTTREIPRMPELAEIGRSAVPSGLMKAERAAVQPVAIMAASPDATAIRLKQELPYQVGNEDPFNGRAPNAPLNEFRRDNGRSEAAGAPIPTGNAPAPSMALTREQPTMSGDVILDGQKVGRWMSDRLTRDAGRPPNGPTGFDPSRSPAWPGATVS